MLVQVRASSIIHHSLPCCPPCHRHGHCLPLLPWPLLTAVAPCHCCCRRRRFCRCRHCLPPSPLSRRPHPHPSVVMRVSPLWKYGCSLCIIAWHAINLLFLAPHLCQSCQSSPCHGLPPPTYEKTATVSRMISSEFSSSNGNQILVSVQNLLGMVLEKDPETGKIRVVEVNPNKSAGKGRVRVGGVLVAVQNASVEGVNLEDVLAYIRNAPRVINLRLHRVQ
jgi:hypothetical protein